jgi:hypothetical protein
MMGLPRRSAALVPSDASYSSACLRAQADVPGAYSPFSGMTRILSRIAARCCAGQAGSSTQWQTRIS